MHCAATSRSGATTNSGSTAIRAATRIRTPPRSCGANSTPSEKRFPLRKKMVVIGHSMGGCISRLLITDSGDKLWMEIFGKPPEQVPLSPRPKMLHGVADFPASPGSRARDLHLRAASGSDLASDWLGRHRLEPGEVAADAAQLSEEALNGDARCRRDQAEPHSEQRGHARAEQSFRESVNTIPITPGIPYHTICGDRGRGDAPKSSDGIVPYWSSHLDGAQSELVVPSSHSAHQNPQAIAEVKRILKLHIASGDSSKLRVAATQ